MTPLFVTPLFVMTPLFVLDTFIRCFFQQRLITPITRQCARGYSSSFIAPVISGSYTEPDSTATACWIHGRQGRRLTSTTDSSEFANDNVRCNHPYRQHHRWLVKSFNAQWRGRLRRAWKYASAVS